MLSFRIILIMAAAGLISSGVKSSVKDPTESHQCFYTTDDKLWFVGLKGVEQKKYSFYHRTALLGSYLACLNLKSGEWEAPASFEELDSDENREDIFFGVGDDRYALIYSRYDGFQFRKLVVWSSAENTWTEVKSLHVDPNTKLDDGRCHLAYVQDPNSGVLYFLVSGRSDDGIKISKVRLLYHFYLWLVTVQCKFHNRGQKSLFFFSN